jgi:hypothetical protein
MTNKTQDECVRNKIASHFYVASGKVSNLILLLLLEIKRGKCEKGDAVITNKMREAEKR